MLNRIKKAYKNVSPESREGKETLRLSRDKLQKAYEMWTQGVLAASENMRSAKIGNPTTEGGVRYMSRDGGEDNYFKDLSGKHLLIF